MSLLNNSYFSMHDFQHTARLYLLDKGIHQGYWYPRWVDTLGFNFGYPLFNFYPPLIYYLAEAFRLFGASLIWSLKGMIVLGYLLGTIGAYLLGKKLTNWFGGIAAAVFFNYFLYHSVLVYVRGAFAEFFAMALLPFAFLSLLKILEEPSLINSLWFGLIFALLLVAHPFVSFPFIGYFLVFVAFSFWLKKIQRWQCLKTVFIGVIIGLSLAAFYWLPSLMEKKYTLTDAILTSQLANYKLHYVCPQQFLYSPWGYGGSIAGCNDGLSFQLGKLHILAIALTLLVALYYWFKKKKFDIHLQRFSFFLLLLIFSLWMTTSYSAIVWDNISYLWYLQFPWRFLTFVGLWSAVVISYAFFFIQETLPQKKQIIRILVLVFGLSYLLATIFITAKYFRPQYLLNQSDQQLTSFSEIAWRVSKSSFEFAPKGVVTTLSDLKTTVIDISPAQLPRIPYAVTPRQTAVSIVEDKFGEKDFITDATVSAVFRLNTFYFPGWRAYLDGKEIMISNDNPYKLITVNVPAGRHDLSFVFTETRVRTVADLISVGGILAVIFILLRKFKQ